jgi:hypothetical protein
MVRWFGWAMLAVLVLCSGCRTAPPLFTGPGSDWKIQQGQALWRPRKGMPELGGDLLLATDAQGRALIEFSKPPITMVTAQTDGRRWWIGFPARGWSFSGGGEPPSRFAWAQVLAALAGRDLAAGSRFERRPEGAWRWENPATGETVEGFLAP